jgi:hypothetical protein
MYLVLYIEHYLQPASPCILKFLSSRCPKLFDETCGSKFKGQGMEEMVYLMGYDNVGTYMANLLLKIHYIIYMMKRVSCEP